MCSELGFDVGVIVSESMCMAQKCAMSGFPSLQHFETHINYPDSSFPSSWSFHTWTLSVATFSRFDRLRKSSPDVECWSHLTGEQQKAVVPRQRDRTWSTLLDNSYAQHSSRRKQGKRHRQELRFGTIQRSGFSVPHDRQRYISNDSFGFVSLQTLPEMEVDEVPEVRSMNKRRSKPWLNTVGPLPALSREEEQLLFSSMQDLLYIESKKDELQKRFGRNPTDKEWADNIGCSIYRLYARLGIGRAARRKMIAANLPLVASIAKQFRGRGLSHQELCQVGAMGLFKSTEKYSLAHNTKFSAYSFFWIFGCMSAAARKFHYIIRIGKPIRRTLSIVFKCKDEFHELHGRNPTIAELVLASKIDEAEIRQMISAIRSPRSLDAIVSADDRDIWGEASSKEIQDYNPNFLPWLAIWKSELKEVLEKMLAILTPREMKVLRLKYGLDGDAVHTLGEVAETLGVNHETVRLAEKRAIKKLRISAKEQLQQYIAEIY
eukprot:c27863_g1_i1 orf=368-1840(+)